jgi:hypothetical protein
MGMIDVCADWLEENIMQAHKASVLLVAVLA